MEELNRHNQPIVDPSLEKESGDVSRETSKRGQWNTFEGGELQEVKRLIRSQNPCVEFKWNNPNSLAAGDWLNMLSDTADVDFPAWEDLRVPITTTARGGNDPGLALFKNNGAGSRGVFIYWFDKAADEEAFFECQLPHAWMEGSTIYPHVHFVPKTTGALNATISWGLEYTWQSLGGVFGNTTIIYSDNHMPTDATLLADRHYLTPFPTIDGTGQTISSMLCCRVFRDATSTGGTDNYDDDAGLLEIDFHYQIDALGSSQETSK